MIRPRLRIRLWMLLALVAAAGLGLGVQRWLQERGRLLSMAAWHERQAASLARPPVWLALHDRRPYLEELLQNSRYLEELREPFRKEGEPIPEFARVPVVTEEQIAREEYNVDLACYFDAHVLWDEMRHWHRHRANQMRRMLLFDVETERAGDTRYAERIIERWRAVFLRRRSASRSIYERAASSEEAYAMKLAHELGPQANQPNTDEAERVGYHQRKAREYDWDAQHQGSLYSFDRLRERGEEHWAGLIIPPEPAPSIPQRRTTASPQPKKSLRPTSVILD